MICDHLFYCIECIMVSSALEFPSFMTAIVCYLSTSSGTIVSIEAFFIFNTMTAASPATSTPDNIGNTSKSQNKLW